MKIEYYKIEQEGVIIGLKSIYYTQGLLVDSVNTSSSTLYKKGCEKQLSDKTILITIEEFKELGTQLTLFTDRSASQQGGPPESTYT